MMSRKDYWAVVEVLTKAAHRSPDNGTALLTLSTIARDLADMFQADNPRFDRDRFYLALTNGGLSVRYHLRETTYTPPES